MPNGVSTAPIADLQLQLGHAARRRLEEIVNVNCLDMQFVDISVDKLPNWSTSHRDFL